MKIDKEGSKKNKKGIKLTPILLSMVMIGSGIALTGCHETIKEQAPDNSNIDILVTKGNNTDDLNNGIEQIKTIEGEDFQIVINYYSDENEWHINADKDLYFSVKTKNLPDDLKIYIDNIHMDTSIVSTKAAYNGIKQDSMDDRIHNSIMLGFPISDTENYLGINTIEGGNQEFIQGYSFGSQYYSSGTIRQLRRLESDYLEDGVYANKIDTVIDLIIVDKETNEPIRQKSVASKLLVEINNVITFEETKDGETDKVTYKYDRDGSCEEISREKVKEKVK